MSFSHTLVRLVETRHRHVVRLFGSMSLVQLHTQRISIHFEMAWEATMTRKPVRYRIKFLMVGP